MTQTHWFKKLFFSCDPQQRLYIKKIIVFVLQRWLMEFIRWNYLGVDATAADIRGREI